MHYIKNNNLVKWWLEYFDSPRYPGEKNIEAKFFVLSMWCTIWITKNKMPFRSISQNSFQIVKNASNVPTLKEDPKPNFEKNTLVRLKFFNHNNKVVIFL